MVRHCKSRLWRDQLARRLAVRLARLVRLAGVAALCAAGPCFAAPAVQAPAAGGARLVLTPCRLEHPSDLVSLQAQCGYLSVPENPFAPNGRGRQIRLFVARIPAVSLHARPDPLFLLAGGPGAAAATLYTEAAAPFARIHRDRDIVLVDQRGTGRSNGLFCKSEDDVSPESGAGTGTGTKSGPRIGAGKSTLGPGPSTAAVVADARQCLAALSKHADVAFYTTSIAVRDLDRVRAALGYGKIDLYGVSYGTRVAQEYLRRFPRHVRAVILDGVVPPQVALGAALPLNAQHALDAIFTRCTQDRACDARFGDPAAMSHQLRSALALAPVQVQLADPTTGAPLTMTFTAQRLKAVLRLSSYASEQAALLPFLLYEAANRQDFAPLASQFLVLDHTYQHALAAGMQYSVVCTEDVPFYDRAKIDRSQLAQTFLGTTQLDTLERICAFWPHGPLDPRFHEPLTSSVPVLLLSGEDDPVTPPSYAAEAARGLSQHLLVELDGSGHGQLTAPCIGRLMADFLERGSTKGLDTSCARRARPFPFFTSFAGPPP